MLDGSSRSERIRSHRSLDNKGRGCGKEGRKVGKEGRKGEFGLNANAESGDVRFVRFRNIDAALPYISKAARREGGTED